MSHMLNSLLTTKQRAQADAADAAMRVIDGQRAKRAVLHTAAQAMNAALRPAYEAIQDTLDPEYMVSQIAEARAMLDAADKVLCPWFGTPNPERAREYFNAAIGFLAEE